MIMMMMMILVTVMIIIFVGIHCRVVRTEMTEEILSFISISSSLPKVKY